MRVIIRITAVILVVFSLGWAGCQSTHSDGPAPNTTTTPVTTSTEPAPQQPLASPAAPVAEPSPNTVPQTVQHTQRGMENMPPPPSTTRPAPQPVRTLALTGPSRVPVRATNQAPASPLVVTQSPSASQKGPVVIGPISFQGPPRHKTTAMTSQQRFWTGVMGALVVAGVAMLVIMRKMPLWRDKLRGMVQRKGGNNDGPKLVLQGAPQRASPLEED